MEFQKTKLLFITIYWLSVTDALFSIDADLSVTNCHLLRFTKFCKEKLTKQVLNKYAL